ncbi:peroxidase 25-like [Hibiscus syriacus]|uniref:peroxidase 25-like n=1 Tax=Hibiscus syriacus TaxID=106335 RepID=UPI0019204593|nr:peroxidase 25-like [Hibiscus syriacus]
MRHATITRNTRLKIVPDDLRALLDGCRIQQQVKMGKRIVEQPCELEAPQCCTVDNLKELQQLMKKMEDKRGHGPSSEFSLHDVNVKREFLAPPQFHFDPLVNALIISKRESISITNGSTWFCLAQVLKMGGFWLVSVAKYLVMFSLVEGQGSGLQNGFYSSSCPKAEAVVRSIVESHFNNDPPVAAGLLRLHFHDCFVQGCDSSVLISGSSSERSALPNLGLRGFKVIDDAKTQLESLCLGVVSCADILALAARDAVDLIDGPSWTVPTGRRDGRVSSSSQASSLPSPLGSIAAQRQKFAAKGLDDKDLVTLVGAHTIGQTDCLFFRYRLYNFTVTGSADPTINQSFLVQLKTLCPRNGDGSKRVALDINSPTKFDVSFFKNVRDGKGVLESDQRLWGDAATRRVVEKYAGNIRGLLGLRFDYEFRKAMIKMSRIEVKTGSEGEIRKICSKTN